MTSTHSPSSSRLFGPSSQGSVTTNSFPSPDAIAARRSSQTISRPPATPLDSLRTRSGSAAKDTASSWLNALSDGLSWIEVQGAQAAEKGLGETIRGGLGGLGAGRRPLSLMSNASGSSLALPEGGGTSDSGHGDAPSSSRAAEISARASTFLGLSRTTAGTPPTYPNGTSTTPPNASLSRPPPQPSNAARLGPQSSANTVPPSGSTPALNNSAPAPRIRTHRPSLSSPSNGPASTGSLPTIPRSSSQHAHQAHSSLHPQSYSTGTSQVPSRSNSYSITPQTQSSRSRPDSDRQRTPYRAGYQPPGVKRSRTDEFTDNRRKEGEERGREEGRLSRRWAKLLDLHFNPNAPPTPPPAPTIPLPRSNSIISSLSEKRRSILSLDALMDNLKPKDVWKGIRSVSGVGVEQVEEERKREGEMGIVKWEEDGDVKRCRICLSVFSLTNRKHHCRLCGRIVCALPPTASNVLALATSTLSQSATVTPEGEIIQHEKYNPRTGLPMGLRREKCSILLVGDWKTGRGEVVEEGFVGWMKVERKPIEGEVSEELVEGGGKKKKKRDPKGSVGGASMLSAVMENGSADKGKAVAKPFEEVMVKGVRCCRECWAIVSRKQRIADRLRITGFTRMYEALKDLEQTIRDILPEFQDMMLNLTVETYPVPPIPKDLIALHKELLTLFQQYDNLAKRIKAYPIAPSSLAEGQDPATQGAEQRRVQEAIARSASFFVAKEAGVLQALPRLQKKRHEKAASSIASIETSLSTPSFGPAEGIFAMSQGRASGSDVALMLQPLLEQEAMLEEYIREANAQRKFDDARTLKSSLEDIRAEIARVSRG